MRFLEHELLLFEGEPARLPDGGRTGMEGVRGFENKPVGQGVGEIAFNDRCVDVTGVVGMNMRAT